MKNLMKWGVLLLLSGCIFFIAVAQNAKVQQYLRGPSSVDITQPIEQTKLENSINPKDVRLSKIEQDYNVKISRNVVSVESPHQKAAKLNEEFIAKGISDRARVIVVNGKEEIQLKKHYDRNDLPVRADR